MTHIGNEFFAWFKSTKSKSRINFLELLRAHHRDYWINDEALIYLQQQQLPKHPLECLQGHCLHSFPDKASWEAHLDRLAITKPRHRRIATEGALLGSVLQHGFSPTVMMPGSLISCSMACAGFTPNG